MNTFSNLKEDMETSTFEETVISDFDTLTACDFSAEQIV